MSWLIIALASSAFMGMVSISDKVVIHKYCNTPLTLLLLIGITQTTVGTVSLIFSGIPDEATLATSGSAIGSGILSGLAAFLSQRVLYRQEVSRTIPITQSAPIFTALLALLILGESISIIQWAGIIVAVLGCASISMSVDNENHRGVVMHNSFYVLMLSAFLFGASTVIGKVALESLPILYTHGLRTITLGLLMLSFSIRRAPYNDVKSLVSARSPAFLLVAVNDFVTAQAGLIMMLWALSIGPASLVGAVAGTRALFTVLYSIGISKIFIGALGEDISTGSVMVKLLSTLLIVGGITALAL
ncbi:MAG: EamA family transporter [Dehalococcoidia bacterium]|nr:EamA family transporter [Dehalococcoidia bacterium]